MKLSILICSLESRRESLFALHESLCDQLPIIKKVTGLKNRSAYIERGVYDEIEILIATDNKQMSVGAKRNLLIEQATGDYIVFIDDDDRITDDYIELLLKGIETGYDSVCFDVMYNPAGGKQKLVKYSCTMKDAEFSTHFERATNHLMCIKRSIASAVKFKNINFGEDAIWAKEVSRLIRSEARIDKVLYYYDFDHGKSETQ